MRSPEFGKLCRFCLLFRVRAIQRGDINFFHIQHGCHYTLGPGRILIGQHVAENNRTHLPRETKFVFEPAARSGRSTVGGKFLPEIIDLVLGFAVDSERDRFGELELRAAVQGHEVDSVECELDRHD